MTELSQIMADIFSTIEDYVHKISVSVTASKPRNSAGTVHIDSIIQDWQMNSWLLAVSVAKTFEEPTSMILLSEPEIFRNGTS